MPISGLSALVLALSLVFVGWFVKTKRLRISGAALLLAVGVAGTMLCLLGMMFWSCEQPQLAGADDVNTHKYTQFTTEMSKQGNLLR